MNERHAEPEPPPYPREWTSAQRSAAYWFVVRHHGTFPTHQSGWYAMLSQAEHTGQHVKDVIAKTVSDVQEDDENPVDPRVPYKD